MPEFKPNLTPEDLREHMNAQHGVGPSLAGMAEYPAHLLPEADPSWQEWFVQYFHGRRTPDDQKQILRWKRMKTLHGNKLIENPTPRRAFALKAWAIDPLKLVDGRSRGKLERAMAAYKAKAEEKHEAKKAFETEDLRKVASLLNKEFRACIDEGALDIEGEVLSFLSARPDIDGELLYARLGDHKTASYVVPDGLWWMEKLARYGAGVLFKQPNGKYLLQENGKNDCDNPSEVGKLRPAGGGKNKGDHNLRATILREMEEEFDIDPEEARGKLKLLGYINEGPFKDCALFEMSDHGLKPGVYQASNSKNEKIKLVEADLDDERYIGKHPDELRAFADTEHPGNKEVPADYACPHCGEDFDYAEEPEVAMGTVACPHCGKFVPQENRLPRVMMRFTRFEIHKLAKMVGEGEYYKSAAQAPGMGPNAWNFDEGIINDYDAEVLKTFARDIHGSPQPWDPEFQTQDFIDTYSNRGHQAMRVKPYGAELLPWIAQARRAYGVLNPKSPYAWKGNLIRPSDNVIEGIDFNEPVAKSFTEFNPDGSVKGVQESALHYLAFRHSPAAAYRQMWQEFDAPNADHVSKLLKSYSAKNPNFNARDFDRFVSKLDPEFYPRKQVIDAAIGREMRPTAGVYADIAEKGLGWDKAVEKPRERKPPSYLPAIAVGAAALGAAGVAYWLWQKHRKKKRQQEKMASAKQLKSVESSNRQVLADLLKAKEHSDKREYGHKNVIMTRLFREHPEDFIMDDDWEYAGITHLGTGFRMHVPRNIVPASIATNPLSKVYQRNNGSREEMRRLSLDEGILDEMSKTSSDGYIAVDLDGTLAWWPDTIKGVPFIGSPIPAMKKRVLGWIAEGKTVKIFTARVFDPEKREETTKKIQDWLEENGMPRLDVTHEKDPKMLELWDDRAVAVERNTGKRKHD